MEIAPANRFRRRTGRKRNRLSSDLARLRLLAIIAPFVVLALVAWLLQGPAHEELHSFPGFLYVLLALALGIAVFSFGIFALIARVDRRLVLRNRQLEAMLAVARAAGSSLRLNDVLDAALDSIVGVTSAEAAEIWLMDQGAELVLERQHGLDAEAFRERSRLAVGEGVPGAAAQSRRQIVVHDLAAEPRFVRPGVVALGFASFGAFPLVAHGDVVGVLCVAAKRPGAFECDVERRLLDGIGEQLSIAIQNARLHSRVLDATVLEERERLARELHDGLAQMLGYVNMQALAIKKLVATGRSGDAEAELAAMEQNAKRVYTDVREAILELRSSREGLLESVGSYMTNFGRIAGLELQLEVDEAARDVALPPSTEIQLVRIVQEALANVRKHAAATSARVAIAVQGDALAVEVGDDGRGFDLERGRRRTGWPHFGLQTMRERAEAVGGTLAVTSRPGDGTTVLVRVPLRAR